MRTTVFLADMNDFAAVNEVYGDVLHGAVPGAGDRAGRAPPEDARVEIDVIASYELG